MVVWTVKPSWKRGGIIIDFGIAFLGGGVAVRYEHQQGRVGDGVVVSLGMQFGVLVGGGRVRSVLGLVWV